MIYQSIDVSKVDLTTLDQEQEYPFFKEGEKEIYGLTVDEFKISNHDRGLTHIILQQSPNSTSKTVQEIFDEVFEEYVKKYPQNAWMKLELIKKSVDYHLAIEAMRRFHSSQLNSYPQITPDKKLKEQVWDILFDFRRERLSNIDAVKKIMYLFLSPFNKNSDETEKLIKKYSEEWQIQREATNRINYLNKKNGWRGFIEGAIWMYNLWLESYKPKQEDKPTSNDIKHFQTGE